MPKLVCVEVAQEEFDSILDGRKHFHIMPNKDIDVGDYLNFKIVGELKILKSTPKELFVATHKETFDQCQAIKKGYAIVTLKKMVQSNK